jgi:hypothetical protein
MELTPEEEELESGRIQTQAAALTGAEATGLSVRFGTALGSLALGSMALGAIAIGAVAIGKLMVKRAVIEHLEAGTVEIKHLKVGRLDIES